MPWERTETQDSPGPRGQVDFAGTDRFEVIRLLGEGGFGRVYEVHDRVLDLRVALKTLRRDSAAAVYRIKREFKSLRDITHYNLVTLHELHGEDDRWFFTMDLIRGRD